MPTVNRKTVVLTGGTDGMGRVAALRLGEAGHHLIVHGRDTRRGNAVVEAIVSRGGSAIFMAADLAFLDDVKRFAARLEAANERIDVLINNAGIGTGREGALRETSADGLERRFAVNYLAPYLLTRLLIAKIRGSAPARIVNVASDGQEPLDFSNLQLVHDYSGYFAYCRSKVAEIMFTLDLADELKDTGVTVNCLHPGSFMDTFMVRQMGHEVVESIDVGADLVVGLALDPRYEGITGRYFNRGVDVEANAQCYDVDTRAKLRAISRELTGV